MREFIGKRRNMWQRVGKSANMSVGKCWNISRICRNTKGYAGICRNVWCEYAGIYKEYVGICWNMKECVGIYGNISVGKCWNI